MCDPNNPAPSVVPAPQPPWSRPVQSPYVQIMQGDGVIDLTTDLTLLSQPTPKVGANHYFVTLPNGFYLRQQKRIYIQGNMLNATAQFLVVGSIAGCASLLFNNAAFSVQLEWDGFTWQNIGGNAQPSNSTT